MSDSLSLSLGNSVVVDGECHSSTGGLVSDISIVFQSSRFSQTKKVPVSTSVDYSTVAVAASLLWHEAYFTSASLLIGATLFVTDADIDNSVFLIFIFLLACFSGQQQNSDVVVEKAEATPKAVRTRSVVLLLLSCRLNRFYTHTHTHSRRAPSFIIVLMIYIRALTLHSLKTHRHIQIEIFVYLARKCFDFLFANND